MFSKPPSPFQQPDCTLPLSPGRRCINIKQQVPPWQHTPAHLTDVGYWLSVGWGEGSHYLVCACVRERCQYSSCSRALYTAYWSLRMPRAVKHSRVFVLKTELLQPRVLRVVDKELGGGVGLCSAHGSQEGAVAGVEYALLHLEQGTHCQHDEFQWAWSANVGVARSFQCTIAKVDRSFQCLM